MSDPEKAEGEFVVGSELGLHARPAGRFAALAARYESEISVGRGDGRGGGGGGSSVWTTPQERRPISREATSSMTPGGSGSALVMNS